MMRRTLRHRGFLLMDMVVGLSIVSVLAVTLAVAAGRYASSSRRLDAGRLGAEVAERVLNEMQIGRRPEPVIDGARWSIERIGGGAQDIEGRTWVRIRVAVDRRSVELVGAVPTVLLEGM